MKNRKKKIEALKLKFSGEMLYIEESKIIRLE